MKPSKLNSNIFRSKLEQQVGADDVSNDFSNKGSFGISHGNDRDKPTIEYDPKIEKTLKKNRSRVKAQRALQFDQQEANSEEGASEKLSEEEIQDNMACNANNQRRTLAYYTNPTTASCGSSIVWPNVDANNFELKPALVQLVQQK
ncbi:hypothetical protein PIB30_084992 [Stylosanthes scabra]|uniref:Uncharacterized protein n=1 Tax=Stylosanthes scabra TaxID=79078 RepID=A0ABU6TS78_9FABA|nr:hypothetical protein [Stylosanthes scabra]